MKTRLIDLKAVWLIMVCALCLASCRDNDYVRSIPASATAVMKIDGAVVAGSHKMLSLLPFGDKTADVIDLSREVYAFETVDGNLGMCARVKDSDALLEALKTVTTSDVRKLGDCRLTDINNSWAVGFNDKSLVVLGPVSAAALPDAQRSIVRMLKQDEHNGAPHVLQTRQHRQPCGIRGSGAGPAREVCSPLHAGCPQGSRCLAGGCSGRS